MYANAYVSSLGENLDCSYFVAYRLVYRFPRYIYRAKYLHAKTQTWAFAIQWIKCEIPEKVYDGSGQIE